MLWAPPVMLFRALRSVPVYIWVSSEESDKSVAAGSLINMSANILPGSPCFAFEEVNQKTDNPPYSLSLSI